MSFVHFRLRGRVRGFRYFQQKWPSNDDDWLNVYSMQDGDVRPCMVGGGCAAIGNHQSQFQLITIVYNRSYRPNQLIGRPLLHTGGRTRSRDVPSWSAGSGSELIWALFHWLGWAILNMDPNPVIFFVRAQFVARCRCMHKVTLANLWIKCLQCGN